MVEKADGEDFTGTARARLRHLVRRSPGVRAAANNLSRMAPRQSIIRVRETLIFAIQCAIAAGLAFWTAENIFDHHNAFFAPIAAADEFTVYSATQIPHVLRVMLALTTGIPEHKIRVIAPDVGGSPDHTLADATHLVKPGASDAEIAALQQGLQAA